MVVQPGGCFGFETVRPILDVADSLAPLYRVCRLRQGGARSVRDLILESLGRLGE